MNFNPDISQTIDRGSSFLLVYDPHITNHDEQNVTLTFKVKDQGFSA